MPTASDGENPLIARVVTLDAAGAVRDVALPVDWGPVGAGAGFLAWQDQRTLWILPTGAATPTQLDAVPDDTWGISFLVRGPFIYWWTDNVDVAGVHRLAKIPCG